MSSWLTRLVLVGVLLGLQVVCLFYAPFLAAIICRMPAQWEGEIDVGMLALAVLWLCLLQLLTVVIVLGISADGAKVRAAGRYFSVLVSSWMCVSAWYIIGVPLGFLSMFGLLRLGLSPPLVFVGFLLVMAGGAVVALQFLRRTAAQIGDLTQVFPSHSHGNTGSREADTPDQERSRVAIDVPVESTPTRLEDHLLLKFVRDRDVFCPRCQYNLRNLTTPRCPECGEALKLLVGLSEPFLAAWATCTVVASVSATIGLLSIAALSVLGGLVIPAGSIEQQLGILSIYYFIVCIPLPVGLLMFRRQFLLLRRRWQWFIAVLGLLLSGSAGAAIMSMFF